jgi:hypothetical protein
MLSDKDILEKVAPKSQDMLTYLQLAFGGNNNAGATGG